MKEWLKGLVAVPMNTWQFAEFSAMFLEKWNKTHGKKILASQYGSTEGVPPLSRDEINALLESADIKIDVIESSICDQTIFMLMEKYQASDNVKTLILQSSNTHATVERSDGMIMDVIHELLALKNEGRKIINYSLTVEHIPMNESESPIEIRVEIPKEE